MGRQSTKTSRPIANPSFPEYIYLAPGKHAANDPAHRALYRHATPAVPYGESRNDASIARVLSPGNHPQAGSGSLSQRLDLARLLITV